MNALLHEGPVAISVYDTRQRFVLQNDQLRRISGLSDAERLRGRTVSELLPGPEGGSIKHRQRSVLETGRPRTDEVRGSSPADPGVEHVWAESLFPLKGTAGVTIAVGHVILDITERVRARERLELANAMSRRIGSTLDIVRTAEELAEATVPHLADHARVDLLDEVLHSGDPAPGPLASDAVMRLAARRPASHAPGEPPGTHATAPATEIDGRMRRALEDGRTVLDVGAGHPDAGPRRMVIPLRERGVALGAVTLTRSADAEPFERDDLMLAEEIVARAAACVDNARRYAREHRIASTLKRSLLPRGVPQRAAAEIAYRYVPSSGPEGLSGDWFDVIPLSGARIAFVVGTVFARGLQATVTMGRLRTAVRTLADLDLEPDELLTRLNDQACRFLAEPQPPALSDTPQTVEDATRADSEPLTPATGSTCLFALYDPVSQHCVMASAGHPPPVAVAPDGTAAFVEVPVGPPLGASTLPFEAREITLAEGHSLALYTDGLLSPELSAAARPERLLEALAEPRGTPEDICSAVTDALPAPAPGDDSTLLVARVRALGPDRLAVWDLRGDRSEVAQARASARRQLSDWSLEHLAFTVELVVSELATNALRYGSTPIQLRLIKDTSLICEVSDGSSTSPHLRRARVCDEGGRGLYLVAQFTRSWGTRYTERGKTIWAALPADEDLADTAPAGFPLDDDLAG